MKTPDSYTKFYARRRRQVGIPAIAVAVAAVAAISLADGSGWNWTAAAFAVTVAAAFVYAMREYLDGMINGIERGYQLGRDDAACDIEAVHADRMYDTDARGMQVREAARIARHGRQAADGQ